VQVRQLAFPTAGTTLVDLPYFDSGKTLRVDRNAVSAPQEICAKPASAQAILAIPRVDQWRCADGAGFLAGLSDDGRIRWKRPLTFVSGTRRINQRVLGISETKLVLSSLEIWSPLTGETVFPAPVREISSEKRKIPIYQFNYAAAHRSGHGDFFVFDPEGSHFEGKGGLYRLPPPGTAPTRLMAPDHHLFSPIYVVELQLDATGRYLLVGEEWRNRGPRWVRFAIYDLDSDGRIFEERHGEGNLCHEPRITVGPDGQVAFSYRNESKTEKVIVHYRLRKH
jgi:hypothetical protein